MLLNINIQQTHKSIINKLFVHFYSWQTPPFYFYFTIFFNHSTLWNNIFIPIYNITYQLRYPDSNYLFPNRENTSPITNRAVYLVYQGICQKLGIKSEKGIIKDPHSFRRNVSTSLVNSKGGNLLIASALLGHSPTVAEKNYLTGIDLNQAQAVANQRYLLN